jgi:hypothetical protein
MCSTTGGGCLELPDGTRPRHQYGIDGQVFDSKDAGYAVLGRYYADI